MPQDRPLWLKRPYTFTLNRSLRCKWLHQNYFHLSVYFFSCFWVFKELVVGEFTMIVSDGFWVSKSVGFMKKQVPDSYSAYIGSFFLEVLVGAFWNIPKDFWPVRWPNCRSFLMNLKQNKCLILEHQFHDLTIPRRKKNILQNFKTTG